MPPTTPNPAEAAALERAISPDRLSSYQTAAANRTGVDPLVLYLWNRDLTAAFLEDIAIVEVALRNSMHSALSQQFGGHDWYTRDIGLDNRSQRTLATAWNRVPPTSRTSGRIVAQLMFGFWRDLLEAGGQAGQGPLQHNCDYETLWRNGLRKAFPGGKAEAGALRQRFTRHWTLGIVGAVHALRNRAAHHESFIDGFPLPGQKDPTGHQIRLTTQQGHDACLQLARLLDRDLATWLTHTSRVPPLLTARP